MIPAAALLMVVLAGSMRPAPPGAVELSTGKSVREDACSIAVPAASFLPDDPAVYVQLTLRGPGRHRRIHLEWVDPAGALADETVWADVPGGSCLIAQLPLAGFPSARKPGNWAVRVRLDGRLVARREFRISRDANQDPGIQIASVTATPANPGVALDLTGSGFRPGAVVHVARFTDSAGWQYLAAEFPSLRTATALSVRIPALAPGEYVAVIRGSDGLVSAPARFVISTGRSYKLPVPPAERWVITQGPHGSFSHWRHSLHAYDIAPQRGRFVVAMRSGVAHTHDLGMHQTPGLHSFGNYITIDHGDGEYSHYAHLATGGFQVRDGERVEQGQRLAVVGNSGYTLGPGGGYHVHVHVTQSPNISAQSIPFRFDEERTNAPVMAARAAPLSGGRQGTVEVARWWTELMTVPPKTALLDVRLVWDNDGNGLDLHLVSPSGRHFGWYGDKTGYSGAGTRPQEFRVPEPEPGPWRVSVQGIRGGEGAIGFRVESELKAKAPRNR